MRVAVLGASTNPERYSHKAVLKLLRHGHEVVPIHPSGESVAGLTTFKSLREIPEKVHTITVYVGPAHLASLIDDIIACAPQRVIANPGTESDELAARLKKAGIPLLEACTLVMLATGEF